MPLESEKTFATVDLSENLAEKAREVEADQREGGTEIDPVTGKKIYKGKLKEIGLVHSKFAGYDLSLFLSGVYIN